MSNVTVFNGRPFLLRLWSHYRENRKFFSRRDAYKVALLLTRHHIR